MINIEKMSRQPRPKRSTIYGFYFLFMFLAAGILQAQGKDRLPITVQSQAASIMEVLNQLQTQTNYNMLYSDQINRLDQKKEVDIQANTEKDALEMISKIFPISYQISGEVISIKILDQQQITGTVQDVSGVPIPGASVQVQGTEVGAVTDFDGKFNILARPNLDILVVSYIGFKTAEHTAQNNIRIQLEEEFTGLDEVVLVGYGTSRKSDLTGAVSDIKSEGLQDMPVTSLDQQLVGRVPGMQIQQGSGAPGSSPIITIRGSGSLGAGNEPLFVIDGMPYSKINNEDLNPLAFINPNDIESISVLKDASSTAIYGSRGSNGVILIKTKNAGRGPAEINLSTYMGISQVPQQGRPQMMNAQEFASYQRDRIAQGIRKNLGRDALESDFPLEYQNLESIGEGTNWYDLILRDALMQNYHLSIQQSTEKSQFYVGLGHTNQEGVIYNSGLKRYSANLKYRFNLEDRFIIDAALNPTYVDQQSVVSGNNRNDFLSVALWANPVMSPYDENGELLEYIQPPVTPYSTNPWGFPNPVFALQERDHNYGVLRGLGNLSLQWNVTPELFAKTSLNLVYNNAELNAYTPSSIGSPNSPPRDGSGSASRSRTSGFNWLWENTLNYHNTFGKHSIAALAGYTSQKSRSRGLSLNAGPFENDLIQTINVAPQITSWAESISEWSIISYLGRLNYSYDEKYYLTGTVRSDGSSRFGSNNRFALFPSAAFAWRISQEDFMENIYQIDQLKLRASYGKSGNNNIGNYSHLSNINPTEYVFNNETVSAATISLANPDLGWEESEQVNLGVDLGMFQHRLTFTADLYRRKSVNMLLNDYIPTITGFRTQLVNKGNVENKGLELALGAVPFRGDFTWDLFFNIAFNRNKVLATNQNNDPILSGNVDRRPSNISEVGQPIGKFYGFILDGVYSQADIDNPEIAKYPGAVAGYPKYRDVNGDGVVQEILDYTALGSPHPDFTYGITSNMQYKSLDLSISLNGRSGGYIVNGIRQTVDNTQGMFNLQKEWVNRWRSDQNPGDGLHANGPQITHRLNSLWLEDATYLRLTNLSLGYTLPRNIIERTNSLKHLRVYVSAQNLITFTNYNGANPEGQASNVDSTLSPGIDNNAYPVPRTITLGLNVKL